MARWLTFFTACCLAWLGSPSVQAERHALVIGVNDCPAFRTGRAIALRKLRGAENDAKLIAQTLKTDFGFRPKFVQILQGEQATSQAVMKQMDRLAATLTAEDQLVFYFAGHGTRRADMPPQDELDDGLDEALCLYDTTPDGENLLVDDQLRTWLGSLKASRVTVILDCCHSGSGTKDSDQEYTPRYLKLRGAAASPAVEQDAKPWTELTAATKSAGQRLMALYACSNEQSAYERRFYAPKSTYRGQFTHYLLAALTSPDLADKNDDGELSIAEVSSYVASQIDREFNPHRPDQRRQQTPRYEAARPTWELIARE